MQARCQNLRLSVRWIVFLWVSRGLFEKHKLIFLTQMTFGFMHCMSFVMLKAHPGQRWRRLFDGDSEGFRELPLAEPPHSVSEAPVDGFKPALVPGISLVSKNGVKVKVERDVCGGPGFVPKAPVEVASS